jgi:hypothetical protein
MKKERLNIAVVYVVRNLGFATLWFENGTLGGNTFSRDRTSIFIRVNRRATKLVRGGGPEVSKTFFDYTRQRTIV